VKKNSSLPLLISLARDQSDQAQRRLQLLLANINQGKQKLGTLESFLNEYQQRMLNSTAHGMEVETLYNYRQFLAKLGRAVEQQSEEIQMLHGKVDAAKKQWQVQERKRLSFETLQKRFDTQQQQEASRQMQKQLDAYATQRAASNIINGE
jgi:flagellar protein FliJ